MTIRYYSYFEGDENRTHVMYGNDITKENWKDFVLNREFGDRDVDCTCCHKYYEEFTVVDTCGWGYLKSVSFSKVENRAEVEIPGGFIGYYILTAD